MGGGAIDLAVETLAGLVLIQWVWVWRQELGVLGVVSRWQNQWALMRVDFKSITLMERND